MAMNREPNKKDFWSWADKEGVGTPMGANVQSSAGEPTPAPLGPSAIDQQLNAIMLNKGIDAVAEGSTAAIKAATAAPLAPAVVQGAGTEALISAGVPGLAPVAASVAPNVAAIGSNPGVTAALTNAGITGLAPAAATSTTLASTAAPLASGMGPAIMASMASNPIGWLAGGYLIGKRLKII